MTHRKTLSVRPRPLIRWFGGKWRLAPWIISHFPDHRIYTEAFGGGGSVLLRKQRCYAEVYNDLDQEVVNLFRVVRDHGEELESKLRLTPFSRGEFIGAYGPTDDFLEGARRTLIKSFMGFGSNSIQKKSGFRNNVSRSGTIPAHDWANYPAALTPVVQRLQGVVIENLPAISILKKMDDPDTLHYVDPPYVHSTRGNNKYSHEMSDKDHVELADILHSLRGKVALSSYDCALYDDLYGGWRKVQHETTADGACPRTETLLMNY